MEIITSPPQSNLGKVRRSRTTTQQWPTKYWLQWDVSKFTPKTVASSSTINTPSNTTIPQPTPLTALNNIRIQSVILPQYTFRPDRPTDRHTHTQIDRPATDTQSISRMCYTYALWTYRLCNASAANGRASACYCYRSQHLFWYVFAHEFLFNPHFDLEPNYIIRKPHFHRILQYIPRREMLSTFHTRVENQSVPWSVRHVAIEIYGAEFSKYAKNHARNSPFPSRYVDFHLTHECLGQPHLPSHTTAWRNSCSIKSWIPQHMSCNLCYHPPTLPSHTV